MSTDDRSDPVPHPGDLIKDNKDDSTIISSTLTPFDRVHIVQAMGIGTDNFIDNNDEHLLKLFSSTISQWTEVKFHPR